MKDLILIAGPCVVESEEITRQVATYLVEVCKGLPIRLVFKASYRKANRTKVDSFQSIGDLKALKILGRIQKDFNVEVLTDVHEVDDVIFAAMYVDILQIPAFLCRQTALIQAAARSGKAVNIKKGQFASWETMSAAAEKVRSEKNSGELFLTERGTTFGYDDLVVDMRNIQLMKQINVYNDHIIVDITHSLGVYNGDSTMIEMLGRCAIAAGADGLFLETHPSPITALSDANSMLPLYQVKNVIKQALRIREAMKHGQE